MDFKLIKLKIGFQNVQIRMGLTAPKPTVGIGIPKSRYCKSVVRCWYINGPNQSYSIGVRPRPKSAVTMPWLALEIEVVGNHPKQTILSRHYIQLELKKILTIKVEKELSHFFYILPSQTSFLDVKRGSGKIWTLLRLTDLKV